MPRLPGFAVTDHVFDVPLDHGDPSGPSIEVFARELADPARAGEELPWLLFLQGGPGGKSPRPVRTDGWIEHALRTHRVLLLDQRGTGRSTPVTSRTAARMDATSLAAYLRHFRADAIVADCELIRTRLCGDEPWETLGQSYGGFLTLSYLSLAPEGLRACHITGGLPGITATADEVYARLYPRVRAKTAEFYARYPKDRETVRRLADHLATHDVRLPDGDRLTPRRLRLLGFRFGMSDAFEHTHWLLDEAFDGTEVSDTFLLAALNATGFADRPLYAVLQECIYGQDTTPTAWAAHRAMAALPEFAEDADPLLFTGEMVYPWMFEDIRALRPFAGAAEILSTVDDWPTFYDPAKLAANTVPVAAVVYHDDMYVDAGLSLATAASVGNLRTWVTNEAEHDGIHTDGEKILARLMDMTASRV
ncbi:alpha/beta fold hydrolase [Amycolatopsis sp. NPDC059021]|uniref:alpha/beta fold hydrolase n=1 Tax=Amycolatopsis sp. NPDC059021 TaxID=3346704 RepID=UPI00366D11E4